VALVSALSASLTHEAEALPAYLARHYTELWDTALHRLIRFRDAGNEDRFFDIGFAEMQVAPMDAVGRLYRWLGEELGPKAEATMSAWWSENAEGRHGARRRDPAAYDLDAATLRERFRFYSERFDVATAA
jgi:hypothetical protein